MSDAKAKFVGLGGERPDRYHKQSTKMLQHNGMMGWGIGECLFSLQIQLFFYLIQRLGMFSVADDRAVHSRCACGGDVLIRIDGGEVTAIHQ